MGSVKEAILLYILILIGVFYYKPKLLRNDSKYKFGLPVIVIIIAVVSYYIVSLKSFVHFGAAN